MQDHLVPSTCLCTDAISGRAHRLTLLLSVGSYIYLQIKFLHSCHCLLLVFCRDVHVIRLISKSTIEEDILHCAQKKLKLEQDISLTGEHENCW